MDIELDIWNVLWAILKFLYRIQVLLAYISEMLTVAHVGPYYPTVAMVS